MKQKANAIPYGFTDMRGNQWCNAWVDSYNALSEIIETTSPHNTDKINFYLDQRHKLFVMYLDLSAGGAE